MTRSLALYALGLPEAPLDAARAFHDVNLSTIRAAIAEVTAQAPDDLQGPPAVTVVFSPAAQAHQAWRLAVIQNLARESVPVRVNGVVGDSELAIGEVLDYLADASGVTGQLLSVQTG